jgi:hypothetical protein
MRFVSVRDFRIRPGEIWKQMKEKDLVVTSNGRPIAILTRVDEENLEDTMTLLRRLRAQMAISRLRQAAAAGGADQMTDDAIEAEIHQARAEQKR